MNTDKFFQVRRSGTIYDSKEAAIAGLSTLQTVDGAIVLARYKDESQSIKTIVAFNCNENGMDNPDSKVSNYTVYDTDMDAMKAIEDKIAAMPTQFKTINSNTIIGDGDIKTIGKTDTNSDGTGEIFNVYQGSSINMAQGSCSHAEGMKTVAKGICTHSEGYQTNAIGDASHAEGYGTVSNGTESHAEGYNTQSNGNFSHSEGENTISGGWGSHAEGYYAKSNGPVSHAEGNYTTAEGDASHAEGNYTTAKGNNSHAEGYMTISVGSSAHTEGSRTNANEQASHAEGYYTTVNGHASHIEGGSSWVIYLSGEANTTKYEFVISNDVWSRLPLKELYNYFSQPDIRLYENMTTLVDSQIQQVTYDEGQNKLYFILDKTLSESEAIDNKIYYINRNISNGDCAHVEGSGNYGNNFASHIEGLGNTELKNSTDNSINGNHIEGYLNIMYEGCNGAHVENVYNEARNEAEHAQGRFNISNTGDSDEKKTLSSIGMGTKELRKNAQEVMRNGDFYVVGIGGYDGTNYSSAKTLQESIPKPYTLPTASSDTLGGIKIGQGLSIDGSGVATAVGKTVWLTGGWSGEIFNDYTNNKARGAYSHAEGNGANASGEASHAEGHNTTASGDSSHAEGIGTTAAAYCQHAMGFNNTTVSSESGTSYSETTRAFIIGNGYNVYGGGNAFYVLFNGETYADGAYSGSGADYAEMFEWSDGNPNKEDRIGRFVTFDGSRIRLANGSDSYVLGIVSGAPMVIGNNPMRWQGKYLNDKWGRPIYEDIDQDIEVPMTPDDEGYDPNSKEPQMKTVKRQAHVRKLNPDWKGDQEYSLRTDRDEWSCVGLMGQLLVVQDGTLKAGGFCKVGNDGVATVSDSGYYVMQVNDSEQALVMFK